MKPIARAAAPGASKRWVDHDSIAISRESRTPYDPVQDRKRKLEIAKSIHRGDVKKAWLECGRDRSPFDCVYFIRMGETSAVKVGHTGCISNRMMQLRVSSPVDLRLAGFVSFIDDQTQIVAEQRAHQIAMAHGKPLLGEWFDLSQDAVKKIVDELSSEYSEHVFSIGK